MFCLRKLSCTKCCHFEKNISFREIDALKRIRRQKNAKRIHYKSDKCINSFLSRNTKYELSTNPKIIFSQKKNAITELLCEEEEHIKNLESTRFISPKANIDNLDKTNKSSQVLQKNVHNRSSSSTPTKITKKENFGQTNKQSSKWTKLVQERRELNQKVIMKKIEKKCYISNRGYAISNQIKEELCILKNEFEKSKLRVNRTELGGIKIRSEKKQVLQKGHFNDFFTPDEKSISSENRPIYTSPICGSCGRNKYNHCSLVCGNTQLLMNCSKKVLQKCTMCGQLKRKANQPYCDLCTIFVTCCVCQKKTCPQGSTVCQNCLLFSPKGRNI